MDILIRYARNQEFTVNPLERCAAKLPMIQGPVVQSIVSLTISIRSQHVKVFYNFITKYTDIFC